VSSGFEQFRKVGIIHRVVSHGDLEGEGLPGRVASPENSAADVPRAGSPAAASTPRQADACSTANVLWLARSSQPFVD